MKLRNDLLLYHGSYAPVRTIDLSRCQPGKDFGRGFYLTTDPQQAKGFIASSLRKARALGAADDTQRHGYISTFRYKVFGIDHLKDQYCFLTENAIAHLDFVEVARHDV